MIRHLFMAAFKHDVDEATRAKEIEDLKAMKEKIPASSPKRWAASKGA